jgi:hypothetical protein
MIILDNQNGKKTIMRKNMYGEKHKKSTTSFFYALSFQKQTEKKAWKKLYPLFFQFEFQSQKKLLVFLGKAPLK